MRKTNFIFLTLLSLLTLASCSKKEEDASLIGRWEMFSQRIEIDTNDEVYADAIKALNERNSALQVLIFREDNTVSLKDPTGIYDRLYYSVDGNNLTISFPPQATVWSFEYSISGKTLTFYQDLTEAFQIAASEIEELEISKVTEVLKYKKK